MNDTSQVVAASAAFSPAARDIATVVKLVRNGLMAPLIVLIAWWWERRAAVSTGAVSRGIRKAVPLFVLGFLTFVVLRTVGLIDAPLAARIDAVASFSILVALSGVGLGTRVAQMRSMGLTPFHVGLGTATLLAALSIAAILGLHLAPHIWHERAPRYPDTSGFATATGRPILWVSYLRTATPVRRFSSVLSGEVWLIGTVRFARWRARLGR